MRSFLITALFFQSLLLLPCCKSKCTLDCTSGPTLYISGYDSTTLKEVIVKSFAANGLFDTPIDSYTLVANLPPWWTTDTSYQFGYNESGKKGGYNLLNYITPDTGKNYYDFEVIIPNVGRIFKLSGLTLAGPKTDEVTCDQGTVASYQRCPAAQYISSYVLDGSTVSFLPNQNEGFIYLHK